MDRKPSRRSFTLVLPPGGGGCPGRDITLAAAACTSSGTDSGSANGIALVRGFGGYLGLAPLKPDAELGLLIVGLTNRSRSPIAISSVTLVGQGVGTVIKALEIKIAPATTGNNSAPGGAYEVSPPAAYWGATGSCTRQPLVPLRGFRLAPRALARVWVVIQAARPGQFHVRAHLVRYRQHGISYQQLIPTGYKGSVSTNARFIPIDKQQARCMKERARATADSRHPFRSRTPRPSPVVRQFVIHWNHVLGNQCPS